MGRCDSCGQRFDDADRFCRRCGHARVADFAILSSEESDRVSRNSAPVVAALALLALVGIAVGLVLATRGPEAPVDEAQPDVQATPANGDGTSTVDLSSMVASDDAGSSGFVGVAPDGQFEAAAVASDLASWDNPELLAIVRTSGDVVIHDLVNASMVTWSAPEPLVDEDPAELDGHLVVIGETYAWTHPLQGSDADWNRLGPADRVRTSTKEGRVWLREVNAKENPWDAEYLWSEVDLSGTVYRTMFRNRDIYFPTPELVSGIGGDLFKLTDAEINPWRIFSPYGVIIAVGENDLVTKECDRDFNCTRVWYDPVTAARRDSVYDDLAENIGASYGARLSPDGRFALTLSEGGRTQITKLAAPIDRFENRCLWDEPFVWTADARLLACQTETGMQLYDTESRRSRGTILRAEETHISRATFVSVLSAG